MNREANKRAGGDGGMVVLFHTGCPCPAPPQDKRSAK